MARSKLEEIVLQGNYPDSFEAFIILYYLLNQYNDDLEYPWLTGVYEGHKEYYTRSFHSSTISRKVTIDIFIRLFELGMFESLIFSVYQGFGDGNAPPEKIYRYNYSQMIQDGIEAFKTIFLYESKDIDTASIYVRINYKACSQILYEQIAHWLKNYHFTQNHDQSNSLYEIGLALKTIIQRLNSGAMKTGLKINLHHLNLDHQNTVVNIYRPFILLDLLGDIKILQIGHISSEDRQIGEDMIISVEDTFFGKYLHKKEILLREIWDDFCSVIKGRGYKITDTFHSKNSNNDSLAIRIIPETNNIEMVQYEGYDKPREYEGFQYRYSEESLYYQGKIIRLSGQSKLLFDTLMDLDQQIYTGVSFDVIADLFDSQFEELSQLKQKKIYKQVRDTISSLNSKIRNNSTNKDLFEIKNSIIYINPSIKIQTIK